MDEREKPVPDPSLKSGFEQDRKDFESGEDGTNVKEAEYSKGSKESKEFKGSRESEDSKGSKGTEGSKGSKGAKGSKGRFFVAFLCFAVGMALIIYPVLATYINENNFSTNVAGYEEKVSQIDPETREQMLAKAREYNENLAGDPLHDPFVDGSGYAIPIEDYADTLNVDGKGMMGTISIPQFGLKLPIYHNVTDDVLAKGIGHIPQTSFPIGGKGTHAVLTGHTGLPNARLFTDLVRMKKGDVFIVEVLGIKHAYAVDEIKIVEPTDVGTIKIDYDQEYVTLLTCTPYGLNTHRLLVRGVPTELPDESAIERPVPWNLLWLAIILLFVLSAALVFVTRRRSKIKETRRLAIKNDAIEQK